MTKHSPEPWFADYNGGEPEIYQGKVGGDCIAQSIDIHDAERAVACVNSLAGIEDPEKAVRELVEAAKRAHEMLMQTQPLEWTTIRMLADSIIKFDPNWGAGKK